MDIAVNESVAACALFKPGGRAVLLNSDFDLLTVQVTYYGDGGYCVMKCMLGTCIVHDNTTVFTHASVPWPAKVVLSHVL
jgi:hypothetical protein